MSSPVDDEYLKDDWPQQPKDSHKEYDGNHLWDLMKAGASPFKDDWDVGVLVKEIEEQLGASVIDIPHVSCGCNNMVGVSRSYMFHPETKQDFEYRALISSYPTVDMLWRALTGAMSITRAS